jgi:LysM repeat protein
MLRLLSSRFTSLCLTAALLSLPLYASAQDAAAPATTHVVQPGENLFRIALSYNLTTDELAAANGITDPTLVYAGQTLTVPATEVEAAAPETVVVEAAEPVAAAASVTDETAPQVIIVEEGSDAAAIEAAAQTASASTTETTEVEGVEAAPQTEATATQETRPVYHTVQRGENLRGIAQANGTTEAELIELNSIANPNRILAGQQLLVRNEPIPETVEATAIEATEANTDANVVSESGGGEMTRHTVQAGEYLSSIARRYGVTNDMIIAANDITDPNQVNVGQELAIPTGLTAAETQALLYAPPSPQIGEGREIVVDLSNSRVYAYDNGIMLYEAVSSNGLPATPTVVGRFTVQSKVRSQTMSGPGYWLPNVEWVMYFYQGYALHGAYWHNNFGQPMSHGCVNLTNIDAKWFYDFAVIGTPVTVQA